MKKLITSVALLAVVLSPVVTVQASPAEDREAFRDYFKKNTPSTNLDDYINGIYTYNKDARAQWEEIEEFPPYEIAIENGEELWSKTFKNGKNFASCFLIARSLGTYVLCRLCRGT